MKTEQATIGQTRTKSGQGALVTAMETGTVALSPAPRMGLAERAQTTARRTAARLPAILWIDLASKLSLVALLVFAVVRDDLPQFQGKAMAGRALTYPLSTLLVPLAFWLVRSRGGRPAYPYGLDITLGLPFLIDTAGNALNLYDTVAWWDDLNHLVNWGILAAGFGLFLLMRPLGKLSVAGLTVGFGAVTAILWEIAEYITFVRHSPELATAYTDTLGDLGLGLAGSVLAAVLIGWVLWPRRRERLG